MNKKIILQPVIVIISYAAGFIFLLQGCFDKHNTYGIVGIPTISADGKYTACIVAESEGVSHYENPTYKKTDYSTSYWLKQYETATGKLQKKKKLENANAGNTGIECYGVYNNSIWLYVNGIRAFDINSLEEITNEEKIAKENGVKKTIFPYGERLINAAVENGYINFTADDGEEYQLQLASLKIINKKDAAQDREGAERIRARLLHKDNYGVQCDTFSNNMFAFAKNETAAMESIPGNNGLHETAYRMKLFKASYIVKPLGNHSSFIYQNITAAGDSTYLNPFFVYDTYRYKVVHLSNPEGYIVIHQTALGEKSKAIITRIDINGKKIWETVTGVSTKIEHCVMGGIYLTFSTNKDYMFSPHTGKDALCAIDIETGTFTRIPLTE